MDKILEEYQSIVDEICKKYNYDSIDKEGNDSLRTVLLKLVPAMLQDTKKEDRQLFYQMLRNTPIVITENLTEEDYKVLRQQYIGNVNPHIVDENSSDLSEYDKAIAAGAYVSEPILNENLQLKGKKSFLYVQRGSDNEKNLFGTDINVSHLIHELGHAWHSEKDEYIMQKDGTLKNRVGTAEFTYYFLQRNDGKFVRKCESSSGLMIEEGMNTVAEEKAMALYLGVSLEEMQKLYRENLVPSSYQGYISNFVHYMLESLESRDFENWRLYGDLESKSRIEALMQKTTYWQNRETDILPNSDSPRNYNRKREIISRVKSTRVQDFFKKYESTYFPDISQMSPLQKIDNVLIQRYNLGTMMYNIEIEDYKEFLDCLGYEGYSLINQASDLQKEELTYTTNNVNSHEDDEMTR